MDGGDLGDIKNMADFIKNYKGQWIVMSHELQRTEGHSP